MVYITGDTHADFRKFNTNKFPTQKDMTRDDFVIICGDFGGVWYKKDDKGYKEQEYWLDWLNEKPFTVLFVDGNHENYDLLNALPKEKWHGGEAQFIRDNVIHLCRGQVFDINGKSFFTFGGAPSHDIDDGILDPTKYSKYEFQSLYNMWRSHGKMFRVNHVSWWKEEMPSEEEKKIGITNLEKYGNKVDYIITHEAPSSILYQMYHGETEMNALSDYLGLLSYRIDFTHWYFGHHHVNRDIGEKFTCLYGNIECIEKSKEQDYEEILRV